MKKNIARLAFCLVVGVFCFAAADFSSGRASAAGETERIHYLNRQITVLAGSLRNGARSSQAIGERLEPLVAERSTLINDLATTDPASALEAQMPGQVISALPAGLRDKFEKRDTVEGELEVIAECDEHTSRTLYFVNTAKERIRINFVSKPGGDLTTGKMVRMAGTRFNNQLVVSQTYFDKDSESTGTAANSLTAAALPNTLGEQKVLVILVNFQDNTTQPYTSTEASNTTFSTISDYYREASYGQTWLTGDVYGWYTIPMSSTNCDTTLIANYAKQAATNAGASLSAYSHYVYAFPQTSACSFSGRGSVGGSPSQAWINGWYELGVVGHELGHNLGIYHSRSMDCGDAVVGSNCTVSEYGDAFDLMGGSSSAHFNGYQKERLGWLNAGASPPLQTVSSSGTYYIDAYGTSGSSPKGLKILKSVDPTSGNRTWYYLEHRTAFGFDSYLSSYPNMLNGVVVHTGSEANPQDIYLLDMTPLTSSWYDPALVAGQTFSDTSANLSIKTLSADSAGAWVEITVNSVPCSHTKPTVAMNPGDSSWMRPGAGFTYTATITNNDAAGCGTSDFSLQAAAPTGWTAAGSPTVSIAPGGNSTITLNVSSSASAADGKYNIGLTAANTADQTTSANASAGYTVVSGLAVAVASSSFKYTRTQKATITANITAAGGPVSGAAVSFTLTKANGSIVTQSATTGTNGVATFVYSFNKRNDPIGTYNVNAVSAYNGFNGKGSTAFSVMK